MKSLVQSMVLAALLAVVTPIHSREFNDLSFPDKVTLAGAELQLNGIGMRTKFVFDIYVGALYTEEAATTRDEVQALKGHKRILMHFVYDEVDAEKLIDGWNDGFENNQSDDSMKALVERLNKFNSLFSTVVSGDVVLLDYVPGKGTIVTIKGEEKGVIEGEDFYAALLDVWLGEEPADDDLKEAMLGQDD